MAEVNIFKYAAKHKLRFPFRGNIATENLYELSVEELDTVYGKLRAEQKDSGELESLLHTKKEDKELEVKIAIVKDVMSEKLEAVERAKKARAKKEERQKLLEAIAKKDEEALSNASKEELLAKLAALDDEDSE